MVTPELIAYIKAELSKSKTNDEIRTALMQGGGWTMEDIDVAFMNVMTGIQPRSTFAPIPQASPQFSITPDIHPTNEKKLFWIGVSIILISQSILGFAVLSKTTILKDPALYTRSLNVIGIYSVAVLCAHIFIIFIFYKLTKSFKTPVRSLGRATFVVSLLTLSGFLLSTLMKGYKQSLGILLVASVGLFILQILFVKKIYHLRFWRSFLLLITNAVLSLVLTLGIIAIIGVSGGALLAMLQTARLKGTESQSPVSSQSTTPTDLLNDLALAENYYQQGKEAGQNEQYSKAIEAFTQAIAAVPDDTTVEHKAQLAVSYLGRSFAKSSTGDLAGAVTDVTMSLQYDAANKLAYFTRASFYMQQNDTPKISADLEKILILDPTNKDQPDNDNVHLLQAMIAVKDSRNQTLACNYFHKIKDSSRLIPDFMDLYKALAELCK